MNVHSHRNAADLCRDTLRNRRGAGLVVNVNNIYIGERRCQALADRVAKARQIWFSWDGAVRWSRLGQTVQ